MDFCFPASNPAPAEFFKRDGGPRQPKGSYILTARTFARSSSHKKAKLLWYVLPDCLTTGTSVAWEAEDGLHALAGHAPLKISKGRIGKIHGDLDTNSLER